MALFVVARAKPRHIKWMGIVFMMRVGFACAATDARLSNETAANQSIFYSLAGHHLFRFVHPAATIRSVAAASLTCTQKTSTFQPSIGTTRVDFWNVMYGTQYRDRGAAIR